MKGQSFRGIESAIVQLFGTRALDATRARFSTELAREHASIVPSGWYPVRLYRDLHQAAAEALPEECELARRLGEEAMRLDLAGIYAFVLRLLGPDRTFRHAERVLATYWEGARVTVLSHAERSLVARMHEMPGLDDRLWQDVLGATRVAAARSANRDASVKVLAGGRSGCDFAEVEITWSA